MSKHTPEKFYRQAHYVDSAHTLKQLPADRGIEVAFAGRSNAGKSSSINTLTKQKSLARTSKTPGRTQQIVLFDLDENCRIADLPGYGFAKTGKKLREHWQQVLPNYLKSRKSLRGVVLLMDIRHPMKEFDQSMLDWCDHINLPVHILLTKADKLSNNEAKKVLFQVQSMLSEIHSLQLFSATKLTGLDELYALLDEWFDR
ncbi:MAG: ribosome biogenesis GTP-binding protein YihA/YsxC [Gammaproteobacteria bacterium]